MKQHLQKYSRLSALLVSLSLLFSLAACGQEPLETPGPSESGTVAVSEPSPSGTESEESHSPAGVSAANLIEGIEPETVTGKEADERFTASQYRFAAELLRRSYEEDKGNCLVSPLSVMLALSMTANGAAGQTLQQMLDVLGGGMTMDELNAYLYAYVNSLPSSAEEKLAIANSIWLNDREDFSVRSDFLKKDVSWYRADIYKTPFDGSAVKALNSWVSHKTDDMIRQIVDKLDEDCRLLLVNAICFDALWAQPYDEYSVYDEHFTKADGNVQDVSMMRSGESEYYNGKDFTGFAKYYEGGGYKFVALLPSEDRTLDEFVAGLDADKLAEILGSAEGRPVSAGLPKFTYDYSAELQDRLKDMGMADAFNNNADFSLLSETNELYISEVIHKTFIEVAEQGTRAGAVTAVAVDNSASVTAEPKEVILDRPFLYMIVDAETALPLFIGTVNEVTQ